MTGEIFSFKRDIATIGPSTVFDVFGFPIANSTIFIFLILILLLAFTFFAFRKKSLVPGKAQAFLEIVYEAIHKQISTITGNDYHTKRVFPIIASIFLFVGVSNYLGLLPGLSSITWDGRAIFRTATGDFNTTFGLALGAIVVLHLISIKDFGILGYINKYIPVKQIKEDMKKGALSPIYVFVTILIACLDIVGEFAKTISVSLRLFGNMYAGDVLTTILIGIFAFVLPSFWVAFGLLGALIQTIVFGSLITVFYMQAAGPEPGTEKS
jgi:F-type H+-transporting ATPase subunit a